MKYIIIIFIIFLIYNKLQCKAREMQFGALTLIIGDQDSGKSLLANLFCRQHMLSGRTVYSTLWQAGAKILKLEDLMFYDLEENCVVCLDEAASTGLGSRGTMYKKNTTDNVVEFFTTKRHYKVKETIVVSPNFQDVLPIIRENANTIVCVQRSILNLFGFNKTRLIGRHVDICGNKEMGTEPKAVYYWIPFSTRFHWRFPAFQMYNTFIRRPLMPKAWESWSKYYPKKTKKLILQSLKIILLKRTRKLRFRYYKLKRLFISKFKFIYYRLRKADMIDKHKYNDKNDNMQG